MADTMKKNYKISGSGVLDIDGDMLAFRSAAGVL